MTYEQLVITLFISKGYGKDFNLKTTIEDVTVKEALLKAVTELYTVSNEDAYGASIATESGVVLATVKL